MTSLVFVDVETTGLDPDRHQVWEIAWAGEDGPIRSAVVPHTLDGADPASLAMNGYDDRVGAGESFEGTVAEVALRLVLVGVTIVGANPAFDAAFLRRRWGRAPWHYRLFDISAYAAGILGHDRPQSMLTIANELRDRGFDIPTPDHSAAADVAALRASFLALRSLVRVPS